MFSRKKHSDMNSMEASSATAPCSAQPKRKLQQDPLTFQVRFYPSILDYVPVDVDKLVICAYNVMLYTIPLSQTNPSHAPLSWCHVPDRLHRSYCVSPGRYVYFRRTPISCLLINQHSPRFHISDKLSPSSLWSSSGCMIVS